MRNVLFRTVVALPVVLLGLAASTSRAAVLSQGFESVSALPSAGWKFSNQSDYPGTGWSQGTTTGNVSNNLSPAADGPANSYIYSNYNAISNTASNLNLTISNWLVTPLLPFNGVDHTMTFKTRTGTGAPYADRLEVRLSSTTNDTGTSSTDVGAFSTTLLTINPTLAHGAGSYPDTWTTYTVNIAGSSVPTNGYIAFRYYVTDGGNGANSNIIGIDTLNISPVPEPTSIATIGLAGAGLLGRRRRA